MDYFQGVVTEYLRADRSVFVNTECLIQLETGDSPAKGRHWYCDALAVNLRESTAYLCEITYSATLQALLARLEGWSNTWNLLRLAVSRDCCIPPDWHVQPWVFIPEERHAILDKKLSGFNLANGMPYPRVTYLESVTPWTYRSWDRKTDAVAYRNGPTGPTG